MTRFRTSWLKPGRILSDGGFSILPKRDRLVYCEVNRTMTVTVDMGVKGFTVFLRSIGRWDDDPGRPIPSEKPQQIADTIRRALESQGQTLDFLR
jgi:hypothetical protein